MKGENIPEPGIPESFKVLIKELQSLALDIKVLSADKQEIEIRELDDDGDATESEFKDELVRRACRWKRWLRMRRQRRRMTV